MPPLEPVDLDALDEFLLSDRAPENSMGLSDLDGFLTTIAILWEGDCIALNARQLGASHPEPQTRC